MLMRDGQQGISTMHPYLSSLELPFVLSLNDRGRHGLLPESGSVPYEFKQNTSLETRIPFSGWRNVFETRSSTSRTEGHWSMKVYTYARPLSQTLHMGFAL